jgi:hypothetical protein
VKLQPTKERPASALLLVLLNTGPSSTSILLNALFVKVKGVLRSTKSNKTKSAPQ